MDIDIRFAGEDTTIGIVIENDETVADIKAFIDSNYDIPIRRQTLFYKHNKYITVLEDDHTASYYNFSDGDIISLLVEPTSIILIIRSLTGKEVYMNVEPSWTVADLKCLIQVKEGIPVDQLRLRFNRKVLDDFRSIEQCNLRNLDVVLQELVLKGC